MTTGWARWEFQNPFRTLKHANFRLLWTGELVRSSAQWMDIVTRGFLVLELTGSATHLAAVNAVRGAPLLLFGLLGGLLADRMDRKRLLMASQGVNITANLAIGVLVLTGGVQLWHVYLTAVLIGVSMSVNAPARQSTLPSLVPAADLQGAVVLNTSTLNIGQAVGPIIGGVAVGLVGIGGSYFVQAAMFGVASLLIRRLRLPEQLPRERERWRDSARDGLRYLRRHHLLPGLLLISTVPALLVQPFRGVVPAIATQEMGLDPARTGLLMAAFGAGALVSVVLLASLPPVRRPGRRIVIASVTSSLAIATFALSGTFAAATAALFVGGLLQANLRTLTQSLVLSDTEDAYRGRIASLWVVNRGTMPIGSALLAALTVVVSPGDAVAVMSVVAAVAAVLIGARAVALWTR